MKATPGMTRAAAAWLWERDAWDGAPAFDELPMFDRDQYHEQAAGVLEAALSASDPGPSHLEEAVRALEGAAIAIPAYRKLIGGIDMQATTPLEVEIDKALSALRSPATRE